MTKAPENLAADVLLTGPGEVRAACRAIDWRTTPLGTPADWPSALRAAVRLCLDSPTAMVILAGPEGALLYNEACLKILGQEHPRALGRPCAEVWPEVWQRAEPDVTRVLEQGIAVRREDRRLRVQRAGRTEDAYFTYSLSPIREEDGRTVGVLSILEETTPNVRARTQDEAFLSFALDHAGTGAWSLDETEGSAYRTLRHDQIFGYEELLPEWSYDVFIEHVVPEDRDEVDRRFRRALATGGDWRFECRIRRRDGEIRWIFATGRRLGPDSGWPGRIVGVVQDVTERKQAEESLRESRARLQAIVDTIPVGLFVFEADGRLALRNAEADRIWAGAAPLESIGDHARYKGFWPATGRRVTADEWPAAQALRGRAMKDVVVDIERFDGTRGTIVFAGAPIRDETGHITGAVGAIQDISELRKTQALLEEADRRKDHFLAVLSHELRNPLMPIRNSLGILRRAPAGSDQARRAADVIARQVDQLAHLVDDLLDVTRITSGKVQLQRETLDLNALVARAVEDNRSLVEGAGLEVNLEPAPEVVVVHVDAHRVVQVVGNLLQNAAKFTPRGGHVTVVVAEDAGEAVVQVRDTGAGLAPDMLEHLFEPFFQVDRTIDRRGGGLGIGLALVKALIEQHGGSVEASSAGLERGTEITLRLPLTDSELRKQDVSKPAAGLSPRRRVLVIEDNKDAADSLRDVLQLVGHEVLVAYDGREGVAKARDFCPDVVLCDIGLPRMDGYAVARAFRADAALRDTYLVALTGYAMPDDLQRAAEAGFDRHLAKPPAFDELEDVFREDRGPPEAAREGG